MYVTVNTFELTQEQLKVIKYTYRRISLLFTSRTWIKINNK